MQKLIVAAVTALCMMGAGSLVMADEAVKSETGTMKSDSKGKKKAHKNGAKHRAAKDKTKAAAPAPEAAPAPAAAPAPVPGQ